MREYIYNDAARGNQRDFPDARKMRQKAKHAPVPARKFSTPEN